MQEGGEMNQEQQQGGDIVSEVAGMLQQGVSPEEIINMLVQQGVSQETSDKRVLSIHQQWTPTSLAIKVIYTFQDHNFQHQFSTSSTR